MMAHYSPQDHTVTFGKIMSGWSTAVVVFVLLCAF